MGIKKVLMLPLVILICVAFFLPWVSVDSPAIGGITKILTGKKQATIDAISAYDVPVLANSDESRFMMSVIKIFQPNIENADKKSYLIWAVPLLAIIIFLLSCVLLPGNRWLSLIFGIIGIAIFAFGYYKITTTDLDKLVLTITIGIGVWLTLWGYLGIGLVHVLDFFCPCKKKSA